MHSHHHKLIILSVYLLPPLKGGSWTQITNKSKPVNQNYIEILIITVKNYTQLKTASIKLNTSTLRDSKY